MAVHAQEILGSLPFGSRFYVNTVSLFAMQTYTQGVLDSWKKNSWRRRWYLTMLGGGTVQMDRPRFRMH